MRRSRVFITFLVLGFVSLAKAETFKLEKSKMISLDIPTGWESAKGLYGIPVTILGPFNNGSRPVLTILSTFLKKGRFISEDFTKILTEFKQNKIDWLETHKGSLVSFEPLKEVEFKTSVKGHHIGAEFKVSDIHYVERSYYLICKDEVFNLKYSLRDEHRQHLRALQTMVESFKCE